MSENIKTFDCAGCKSFCNGGYHMEEDKDGLGEYILKTDYDALRAQVATLTAENEALKAWKAVAEGQEPVAWLHDGIGRRDTCHADCKSLWMEVKAEWKREK